MKRRTNQWVLKAEDDVRVANGAAALPKPARDAVCFHCQQAVEKYLKAMLQEVGAQVPKTHGLTNLLDLLLPYDKTLAPLRRKLKSLTRYAVDYRYPGLRATSREMKSAMRFMETVRTDLRTRLGLKA